MAHDEALAARIRDRPMPGRLRVETQDVATKAKLAAWVKRGAGYAASLPAK